jgi:hypothetical protein
MRETCTSESVRAFAERRKCWDTVTTSGSVFPNVILRDYRLVKSKISNMIPPSQMEERYGG